jgi:hypothetical protein
MDALQLGGHKGSPVPSGFHHGAPPCSAGVTGQIGLLLHQITLQPV